jgi:hypothetical protein
MTTKPIKLKSDIDDVLDAFALQRNTTCEILDKWLTVSHQFDETEQVILEKKRKQLEKDGDGWNEEELKMQFLAFLFEIAAINEQNKIKLFFERPLSAVLNGYELSVVCDAMVATPKGIGKPKKPYFFLQEFKKQKNAPDAEGQMLMAMLIAQAENGNENPVYGCWIQGRYWIFTTLHQKNYCVSKSYDATNKESLATIMSALRELKVIILKQISSQLSVNSKTVIS